MASPKTVKTPRREARLYLAKAQQFIDEASDALAASRNDAAMLNSIHAAISAADAVCVALAGMRSADPDHRRAADLLGEIASPVSDAKVRARQLRELLARKIAVEYESRQATAKEARDASTRAKRFVDWAAEIVGEANL